MAATLEPPPELADLSELVCPPDCVAPPFPFAVLEVGFCWFWVSDVVAPLPEPAVVVLGPWAATGVVDDGDVLLALVVVGVDEDEVVVGVNDDDDDVMVGVDVESVPPMVMT